MQISAETVAKVAELAHLELSKDELAHYQTQLAKVLGYVEQLSTLDDGLGKNWRSDTVGDSTLEREDLARPSLPSEVALSQAPEKAGSAFQVPRIIE